MAREHFTFFLAVLLLSVTVVAVFSPLLTAGFINYDDNIYVYENARVRQGITWANVKWTFTTTYFGFYYPVTWLAHMLDVSLYGPWAGGHHLSSVLIHLANVLLLLAMLWKITGTKWRSLAVAAIFALHPLHVESVAWIAERKDVLSTTFLLLTLLAYARYTAKPSWPSAVPVHLFFLLGLMTKPMIASAPFLMLLLDYWPLGRLRLPWEKVPEPNSSFGALEPMHSRRSTTWPKAIAEKSLLFLMSFASLLVTHAAQQSGGAISTLAEMPMSYRVLNAFTSCGGYIGKMVMPVGLAVLYPFHKGGVPVGPAMLSFGLLVALVLAIGLWWRKHPYILVGSLWYLGTLFPVIGLVQVGSQASADRYTYFPLVGLFIIIIWGGANIILARPACRHLAIGGLCLWLLLLSSLSYGQAQTWHDNESLWGHAIAVTRDNYIAYGNLGGDLATKGRNKEAEYCLKEAIRIAPGFITPHITLAGVYLQEGEIDRSIRESDLALRLDQHSADALSVHASALVAEKRYAEAERDLQECVRYDSVSWLFPASLGDVLELQGKTAKAIAAYEEGLLRSPSEPYILYKMALALEKDGNAAEAEHLLDKTLAHSPEYADALGALSHLKLKSGHPKEAMELAVRACSLTHDGDLKLLLVLAEAQLASGNRAEAVRIGEKLLAHAPPGEKEFKSDVEALLASARGRKTTDP